MKKKTELPPTIKVTPKIIKLTPEYLYKKGKKLYQEALEEESSKQQEKFTNAILYLQGAMLLGSSDACAYLSEFYREDNHLGINNKNISNLVKTVANIEKFLHYTKLTNSICLKDFVTTNYSELKELAIIESGYMHVIKSDRHKIDIPEYKILFTLKKIITELNTYLPPEYHLITDESSFACKEEIQDFIEEQEINNEVNEFIKLTQPKSILENTKAQSQPIPPESQEEYRENIKNDDYGLIGAINCAIS